MKDASLSPNCAAVAGNAAAAAAAWCRRRLLAMGARVSFHFSSCDQERSIPRLIPVLCDSTSGHRAAAAAVVCRCVVLVLSASS